MSKTEKKHTDKEKDTNLSSVKDIKDEAVESHEKEIKDLESSWLKKRKRVRITIINILES